MTAAAPLLPTPVRDRIAKTLAGAVQEELERYDLDFTSRHAPDRLGSSRTLVRLVLCAGLGFRSFVPWEKCRWAIPLTFKGRRFIIADQKFGLRIHGEGENSPEERELLSRLNSAVLIAADFVSDFGKQQIADGNVTISNQYHRFRDRYALFRRLAEETYGGKLDTVIQTKPSEGVFAALGTALARERNGGFFASAAVESYFSYLEHLLVLLFPFALLDPTAGRLEAFLRSGWDEKLLAVLPDFHRAPNGLSNRVLAEKRGVRNPLAHGGIENDLGSIGVHLPGFGAVPLAMERATESVTLSALSFLDANRFAELTALFDELDGFIERDPRTKLGVRYAQSGVSLYLDPATRARYDFARSDESAMEALLDELAHEEDRHDNAE